MLTSTLGGLIKDYRIKKRLSQLEVSLRIGWKDTTRLSKIEQGRVGKPTRETVDKIIKALELLDMEIGQFLLVGGYLPTEEEINNIRRTMAPILNSWNYPATIFDFSWRVIDQNKANIDLYQLDPALNESIFKNHMRIHEIIFDSSMVQNKLLKGEDLEKWHQFLTALIVQFKHEQRDRTNEKWFTSYIKSMQKNDLFRKIWKNTQGAIPPEVLIGKFAYKLIVNPKDPEKVLRFYLFVVPVVADSRFEMEVLIPMNTETYEYYNQ